MILLAGLTGLPVHWQKSRYNALPGGTTTLTKAQRSTERRHTNNHSIKLGYLLYAIYCSLKLSEYRAESDDIRDSSCPFQLLVCLVELC